MVVNASRGSQIASEMSRPSTEHCSVLRTTLAGPPTRENLCLNAFAILASSSSDERLG